MIACGPRSTHAAVPCKIGSFQWRRGSVVTWRLTTPFAARNANARSKGAHAHTRRVVSTTPLVVGRYRACRKSKSRPVLPRSPAVHEGTHSLGPKDTCAISVYSHSRRIQPPSPRSSKGTQGVRPWVLQGFSLGTPGYFKRRFGRCLIVDADGGKHNNLLVQKSCEPLCCARPYPQFVRALLTQNVRSVRASICAAGHAEMPDYRQTDAKVGETVWEAQLAQQVAR